MTKPTVRSRRADVLFYVQHLLGIGHQKRAATLARALRRAGFTVVFVSGGFEVPGLDVGGARFVQLPPVRAVDRYFKVLVDAHGRPIDEAFKLARRARLLQLFRDSRPRILLIEMFPFGRRQMRFELLPLLEAARTTRPRPLVVSSVRDILVRPPKPRRIAEMAEWLDRLFDLALVHGDPALIPFERTFPAARGFTGKLRYTGYVVDEGPTGGAHPRDGNGEVIVSTGGGAVSEALVEAALAARPLSPLKDTPWRILIGHNLPERRFRSFAAAAPPDVTVERSRPDFLSLLPGATLSISQAGYNTIMEVLHAGCPCVVVPYAGGLETEQTLRARLLAERGVLTVVEEAKLTAASLAAGVRRALDRGAAPGGTLSLETDGAAKTAEILAQQLAILRP
ncbi:MAG: glycosyltransferase family protein [Kiloniellaceae bacterium]